MEEDCAESQESYGIYIYIYIKMRVQVQKRSNDKDFESIMGGKENKLESIKKIIFPDVPSLSKWQVMSLL